MLRAFLLLLAAAPLVHASAVSSLPPQAGTLRDITAALGAPEPEARAAAACALRKEGDAAAAAVPQLVALLGDGARVDRKVCDRHWLRGGPEDTTTPGEQAAVTLVAIGTRSFEPLLNALSSSAWIARRNAAWALGALDDPRAVGLLQDTLKDREPAVREQAAWALGAIGDGRATGGLVAVLEDADPRVRRQAAWALGAIGDSRALDGLLPLLKDSEPGVRRQAAWAIGIIGR